MDKTTKVILALETLCAILFVAAECPEAAAAMFFCMLLTAFALICEK